VWTKDKEQGLAKASKKEGGEKATPLEKSYNVIHYDKSIVDRLEKVETIQSLRKRASKTVAR